MDETAVISYNQTHDSVPQRQYVTAKSSKRIEVTMTSSTEPAPIVFTAQSNSGVNLMMNQQTSLSIAPTTECPPQPVTVNVGKIWVEIQLMYQTLIIPY